MIRLSHVSRIYHLGGTEVRALDDVSLDVENGEYLAITGPSGSGKSTLMNLLGCLDRPDQGTYELDGQDVSTLSPDELATVRGRKLGFVFQSFNLLPRVPAVEQVELPLLYQRVPDSRARALEALRAVGLGDRVDHRPNELSGGQQQRVAIARAIVSEPSFILADEPTGNLASGQKDEVMHLLEEMNRARGITLVVVTHEPEIAGRAHRVVALRDGCVVQDARAEAAR